MTKHVILFGTGRWRACIAPLAGDDIVIQFAASELRRYLERIAGQAFPAGIPQAGLIPIILEHDSVAHLVPDAYTIIVDPARIILRGTNSRGVLYAVYAFLEELGCLWTYPTADEEIVPHHDPLHIDSGAWTVAPTIAHRGLGLYGLYEATVDVGLAMIDWMAKNRMNLVLTSADRQDEPTRTQAMHWPEVATRLLPEIHKRGMILELGEHMTHLFLPPAQFEKHPEWFALIKGVRTPRQMCFSNRAAVDYFAARLGEYAAAHPEVRILGTWPLDGGGYCECAACQKPDVPFKAVCRMAEEVARVRPDITVEYLAYTPRTMPVPVATDARPNMQTLVCDRLDATASGWVGHMRSARGACYFEYTLGDNYRWKGNVWLRPADAAAIAFAARDAGYHGVVSLFLPISSWWRAAFNTWFFARACWSPATDQKRDLKRHVQSYFGRHAARIYILIESILNQPQGKTIREAWHSDVDSACAADIVPGDDAARQALLDADGLWQTVSTELKDMEQRTDDTAIRRRVQRWRQYVDFHRRYYAVRSRDGHPLEVTQTPIPQDLLAWMREQQSELSVSTAPADFIEWRFDKFTAWGG